MELAENFLEPFAKGLRFDSRKSRRTLVVSQVVSLCLLSGIFEGGKAFSCSPKAARWYNCSQDIQTS